MFLEQQMLFLMCFWMSLALYSLLYQFQYCYSLSQVWDTMIIESALKTFYSSDLATMIRAIQNNITVYFSLYPISLISRKIACTLVSVVLNDSTRYICFFYCSELFYINRMKVITWGYEFVASQIFILCECMLLDFAFALFICHFF